MKLPQFAFLAVCAGLFAGEVLNKYIDRILKELSAKGAIERIRCVRYRMIIELTNAILWGMCVLKYGVGLKAGIYGIFCSVLLTIAIIDWRTQQIPYRFQVALILLGLLSLFSPEFSNIKERLIGMVIVSVPMLIITLFFGGFGGGDIQLMTTCGFLLGFKINIPAFIIGLLAAALMGIVTMKKKIPLGPFLSFGLICTCFCGETIYLYLFF